ncbi:MAG TPA: nitroreductase family protein [Longimicrobiales bacterium]|nr:nitroreductase family protein [Longimicrobiales bacterium]
MSRPSDLETLQEHPMSVTSGLDLPQGRPAPTDVEIHPLLAARWSPRAIASRPVDPRRLRAVFEAARWAPSTFNDQPWRFLVATPDDPAWLERLRGFLSEGNAWARRAPVLVASAYRTTFTRDDRPHRLALRDLGAAEENAFLEAFHQGLVMHQMAGFDHERVREELLPDGFEPGSMWAIGHPGEPADLAALPERKRDAETAPRRRRPLAEATFGAEWGDPAAFLEP